MVTTANRLYSPRETLNPAKRNVVSDGIGMHALSASIRTKMPGSPRASMTSTANSTIGSVSEAVTTIASRIGGPLSVASAVVAIPLFDTRTPLAPLQDELRAAIQGVVESGTFILGPQVAAFEDEF